jgi:transcriptional regulator with XRE-family HTH domain
LAEALGSSQSLISEWEKDISRPSAATLTAISKLFHLPLNALTTGEGFFIPDHPDAKPHGGLMSKREVQELQQILPNLSEGQILQVDTETQDSELVGLKGALAAMREAKREGRTVWLVIGKAKNKKPTK